METFISKNEYKVAIYEISNILLEEEYDPIYLSENPFRKPIFDRIKKIVKEVIKW